MADTAIVDVDGTLVDTNYQHAVAWFRAFATFGIVLPVWALHRHVGMGGDQFVPTVAGETVERLHGDELRALWKEEFDGFLAGVRPLDGASELLEDLKRRQFRVVLASSGNPDHVEHFLDIVEARPHIDGWTTSEDVDATKPEPDLLQVALDKVDGRSGVVVGDTTWDCEAAVRMGVPTIALRTGGFGDAELVDAGAVSVFDSPAELRDHLDETPLSWAT